MALRHLSASSAMPPMNNHRQIEQYCNKIISVLNSPQKCLKIFEKASEIIEEQCIHLSIGIDNRDAITTQNFVEQFKKRLEQEFLKTTSK
jgi:predicted transglutaminase-like protease